MDHMFVTVRIITTRQMKNPTNGIFLFRQSPILCTTINMIRYSLLMQVGTYFLFLATAASVKKC